MSDYRQWIEAAVAQQRRAERAEHDLAAARARLDALLELFSARPDHPGAAWTARVVSHQRS